MTQWKTRDKEIKGNTVFLRKKYSITGKKGSLWTPTNITTFNGFCYESIDSSVSQEEIISYLKMSTMQCRKNITVEDNEKKNKYS